MARPTARRASLYCTVISEGDLVIVRMPKEFVTWTMIRKELHASIRREHGTLAKNVHGIEHLANDPEEDGDDGRTLELCAKAFAGDTNTLKDFALHAWNDSKACFELARRATK